MAWKIPSFTSKRGIAFNCKREERDGVRFIRCDPIEKKDNIKQALSESSIIFKIPERGGKKLEMISDGGADKELIKELDEYLAHFI